MTKKTKKQERIHPSSPWSRWLGAGILILSFAFYGSLLLLPFLPITGGMKATGVPVLIVLGEVAFWIGGILLGKEVVARYRHFLNPRYWRRQK
jgi:hypothetical protein